MLQKFDLEIKDKKGVENVVVDHLSRLENMEVTQSKKSIMETSPDEQLMTISERPWFTNTTNYKASNIVPEEYTWQQRKCFYKEECFYLWGDLYLFKRSPNGLLHRCVTGKKADNIM